MNSNNPEIYNCFPENISYRSTLCSNDPVMLINFNTKYFCFDAALHQRQIKLTCQGSEGGMTDLILLINSVNIAAKKS